MVRPMLSSPMVESTENRFAESGPSRMVRVAGRRGSPRPALDDSGSLRRTATSTHAQIEEAAQATTETEAAQATAETEAAPAADMEETARATGEYEEVPVVAMV